MTVDEWLKRNATHTCPFLGGKFHPSRCDERKKLARKVESRQSPGWDWVRSAHGLDLSQCLECDGPVPVGTVIKKPEKVVKPISEPKPDPYARQRRTHKCKTCGDTNPENFWSGYKARCKSCNRVAARAKAAKLRAERKGLAPRNVGGRQYRCRDCGQSDTTKFYVSERTKCKACCKVRDAEYRKAQVKKYEPLGLIDLDGG